MSHTERHLQRAWSTTQHNTFNHNLSKFLDFVLELQKSSAAKSIFRNSKYGRSATQHTHKFDRPLTERWLHVYSTFSTMVRISTAYTGGIDKSRRPRNLAQPYRNKKLPWFADQYQKTPSTTEKEKSNLSFKYRAETYRNMDIAKVAGHRPEGDTRSQFVICISIVRW